MSNYEFHRFRRSWTPAISLVHPSARPEEALKTMRAWLKASSKQAEIEYVICFDYGRHEIDVADYEPARVVWNYNLPCSVDATNHACQCAVGRVLVVISDDIYPCPLWDLKLKQIPRLWGEKECVVRVKTGGGADQRGLMAVQIANRTRYERLGYLFHPSYLSMYADDEFSLHAAQDGVVVEAPEITFPHHHWSHGGALHRPMDPVYAAQNGRERYAWGEQILRYRKARDFGPEMPDGIMEARRNQFYCIKETAA